MSDVTQSVASGLSVEHGQVVRVNARNRTIDVQTQGNTIARDVPCSPFMQHPDHQGGIHFIPEVGAQVKLETSQQAVIEGVEALVGRRVEGADMRAGAAMVIAALAARSESTVYGRHYILRGYQNFEEKLTHLGARIELPNGPAQQQNSG